MSYELKKPISNSERRTFIITYNHNKGLEIVDTERYLFALEPNEIMGEKEIEIEVPDYDTEGNQIIVTYETMETIEDYDDNGALIGSHEVPVTKTKLSTHTETIVIPYPVLNPEYPAIALANAKKAKHLENDDKGEIARENQHFTVTIQNKECTFQTTRKTQQDLGTAKDFIQLTEQPYQWFSDNNEEVYLTLEDVINISTLFIQKANIYPTWSRFETAIDAAQTAEEVESIVINYNEDANNED